MDIKRECEAVIDNEILASVLWYLQEYPDDRTELAIGFKTAFNKLIDQIMEELSEEEEEE